ncbi:MAG: hypothetical protein HYZ34_15210 [Ignavibacteriae bacterium]|nr:hypothetical protein [Ignavibacteriota bacterium]
MVAQAQKKTIADISLTEFKKIVRKIVSEELTKNFIPYYVDEHGIKIALIQDDEDHLELREDFKKGLRKSLKETKNRKTIPLQQVRKTLGI